MSSYRLDANGRFWSAYYKAQYEREPLIITLRWRHKGYCPGYIRDPHPAIGKFRRWHKRGDSRKAWRLYWRLKGGKA